MDITLHLSWWVIPTAIFLGGSFWALFLVNSGSGWFAGLTNLLAMIPVLLLSLVAFIIAGILK